jgi:hypothetical protein
METQRRKQFVVEHTLAKAIAFALVVSVVTALITLAVTGDLFSLRQTNSEPSETGAGTDFAGRPAPADSEALSLSDYLDLEVNARANVMKPRTATSNLVENWEFMEENPALFTRNSGITAKPQEHVNGFRFFEDNVLNFPVSQPRSEYPREGR